MSHIWLTLIHPWLRAWHTCRAQPLRPWPWVKAGARRFLLDMLMLPLALLGLCMAWLLNACSPCRRLTAWEQAQGEVLFDQALLARTRVALPSPLLRVIHRVNGGRPFVCLHVVYPGRHAMNARTWQHELTHVWQHTWMGAWYMVHALSAQWRAGLLSWWRFRRFDDAAAYVYDPAQLEGVSSRMRRYALNPEQQAEVVATYGQGLSSERCACPRTQACLGAFVPRLLGLS